MRASLAWMTGILLLVVLSACTPGDGQNPTVPPIVPTHRIAGSVFPVNVAGYTALGPTPSPSQMTVTYSRDSQPRDLAVVTFDPTGEFGKTELGSQQWYRASRCGILWKGDPNATPQPQQVACITVLSDGVMTTISGGQQTPEDLADLANGIYELLS